MSYVEGFVIPVPTEHKQAYIDHARAAWAVFADLGALRVVECWGDDVPWGEQTSFPRAVQLEEGETVVFGWIEWPSREVRDAAHPKMFADPRMAAMQMPFDGRRMILGGFVTVYEDRRDADRTPTIHGRR